MVVVGNGLKWMRGLPQNLYRGRANICYRLARLIDMLLEMEKILLFSPLCCPSDTKNVVYCVYSCTCGYYGDSLKPCTYGDQISKRISGPLLDRIDIHIEVPRVDYKKLSSNRVGETSESMRQRVQAARDIQNKRFSNGVAKDIVCNADMRVGEVRQFCQLQAEGQSLIRAAMIYMPSAITAPIKLTTDSIACESRH